MNINVRDKNKKKGLTRFARSFKHSFEGLAYAYRYEQSMTIHVGATILVIVGGLVLNISSVEWLFLMLLIGSIMGIELLNTSIEATIDLISPKIHPLAKIAKDTASAAVFILSMVAVLGGLGIFVPKIIEKFF